MSEYPVGATQTSAQIVELLAAEGEMGVTELAERLDRSKGSVHAHLTTLTQLDVVHSTDGRYQLGLKLLDVGMRVRDSIPLYETLRSSVAELADSTGESATLVVSEGNEAVYAAVQRADRNARRVRLGSRAPLHATAPGKVLLASRSREAIDSYVAEGLATPTDRTITAGEPLRDALRSVADQRLAFDRGELFTGMRGVAAPVRDDTGVVAALAVQGPPERLSGKRLEEDLSGLVLSAAKQAGLQLT